MRTSQKCSGEKSYTQNIVTNLVFYIYQKEKTARKIAYANNYNSYNDTMVMTLTYMSMFRCDMTRNLSQSTNLVPNLLRLSGHRYQFQRRIT